jgi:hypothetical protein
MPFLNLIKLIASLSAYRCGKATEIGKRSTSKLDWFGTLAHGVNYTK